MEQKSYLLLRCFVCNAMTLKPKCYIHSVAMNLLWMQSLHLCHSISYSYILKKDGLSFKFDILFSHKYQVLGALFNVAPMYFSFNVYLDM